MLSKLQETSFCEKLYDNYCQEFLFIIIMYSYNYLLKSAELTKKQSTISSDQARV